MKSRTLLLCVIATLMTAGAVRADQVVGGVRSAVVAGHPEATRLGLDVLRAGGNAADAMVTVSAALGVVEPGNSGLGGKFVLLYYDAKAKRISCVVALGAAPLKLDVQRVVAMSTEQRKRGYAATCTPGLVAGLAAAHAKWGTRPWKSLIEPVATLAEDGVVLSDRAAEMMAEFPRDVDAEAKRIYAPRGEPKPGDRLRNPDLGKTLRVITDGGPDAFYKGAIAQQIVDASRNGGGWLTLEDFSTYQPRVLEPLSGMYRRHTVYSSPPPLSGGATLLLALAGLEQSGWSKDAATPRDADYIDAVSRIVQQVYPVVTRSAGDVPDALDRLSAAAKPEAIKQLVNRSRAADPRSPFEPRLREERAAAELEPTLDDADHASTTHFIIVDRFGNIACATQSLSHHFGAAVVPPGTGILLNDEMSNFAYQTRSSVNFIAPGKWPRSTITPTIVLDDDGRPVLALGSPAGQRIPTAVLQVLLDRLDFGKPLGEAIDAPRFHLRRPATSREPPNVIDLEPRTDADVVRALNAAGWDARRRKDEDFYFGSVAAVAFHPDGTLTAAADTRRTADAGGD